MPTIKTGLLDTVTKLLISLFRSARCV